MVIPQGNQACMIGERQNVGGAKLQANKYVLGALSSFITAPA